MTASYQLGKYLVEEELGRGGFANVYKATDTNLGRAVALKILDPLLMRDAQWVARFRREARAVALLEHPHIVPVYEIDEIDGRMFIAMKYINGPNLSVFIQQKGHLTWNQTLHILRQITDALDYAHVKGVIHRDLKPGNILVDDTWHAYLSDFGFAGMVGESQYSVSLSGGIVGTPAYIAPEIWDGHTVTTQVDMYSLGCVLYEMVAGQVLFKGDSVPSVMRSHFRLPAFPTRWPSDTPVSFPQVLQKALAQKPLERFDRGDKLIKALTETLEPPVAQVVSPAPAFTGPVSEPSPSPVLAKSSEDNAVPSAKPQEAQNKQAEPLPLSLPNAETKAEPGELLPEQTRLRFWVKVDRRSQLKAMPVGLILSCAPILLTLLSSLMVASNYSKYTVGSFTYLLYLSSGIIEIFSPFLVGFLYGSWAKEITERQRWQGSMIVALQVKFVYLLVTLITVPVGDWIRGYQVEDIFVWNGMLFFVLFVVGQLLLGVALGLAGGWIATLAERK